MPISLPLDEMSTAEKLRVMEDIWDDLCRNPSQVPSPEWHGQILAERERLIAQGKAKFADWEEVRRRLAARCDDATGWTASLRISTL